MIVRLQLDPRELYDNVHELVRMAFPGCEISLTERAAEVTIVLQRCREKDGLVIFDGLVRGPGLDSRSRDFFTLPFAGDEERRQMSRITRRFIYDLLVNALGEKFNPYGILTGMRPVKLVHRLWDEGLDQIAIVSRLKRDFRLRDEKARLLVEVAENNRPYLLDPSHNDKVIALYIGIPFCPSRCYYCSFPGAILKDYERDMKPFLKALHSEMETLAPTVRELGYDIQSVYLGGGTPTVLSEEDLGRLFDLLNRFYISSATREITVEAGRPDTLTPGKLKLLKDCGVDRICINPQTMNEGTLRIIGRNHDLEGVVQSLDWARETGINTINMDLIVGLPGEGLQENLHTAEQVLKLKPDNITVHTLAVKKGSALAQNEGLTRMGDREEEVHKGVDLFAGIFRQNGYIPYYLYRQKYIKASMENIGYSLPGKFNLYNIQVMEERQTLLGLGGGAGSKFFDWRDGSLKSFYNPKNPQSYCDSLERLVTAKVDKLRGLH